MINYFIVDKYLEDWTLHIFFDDIIKIEPFKDEQGVFWQGINLKEDV